MHGKPPFDFCRPLPFVIWTMMPLKWMLPKRNHKIWTDMFHTGYLTSMICIGSGRQTSHSHLVAVGMTLVQEINKNRSNPVGLSRVFEGLLTCNMLEKINKSRPATGWVSFTCNRKYQAQPGIITCIRGVCHNLRFREPPLGTLGSWNVRFHNLGSHNPRRLSGPCFIQRLSEHFGCPEPLPKPRVPGSRVPTPLFLEPTIPEPSFVEELVSRNLYFLKIGFLEPGFLGPSVNLAFCKPGIQEPRFPEPLFLKQ